MGIVVDVPPVKSAGAAEMPDWQFRMGSNRVSQGSLFVYEALQQFVYRNPEPPSLVGKSRFGFPRNFDAHGTSIYSNSEIAQQPNHVIAQKRASHSIHPTVCRPGRRTTPR
jgi:hypothetical protein